MLGGSGCQGKRSCQENREETTGTRTEADQSESSPLVRPLPSSGPEQPCHPWASAGYGKDRVRLACVTGIKDSWLFDLEALLFTNYWN